MTAPGVVYRVWSDEDELLYVGVSMSPTSRIAQHANFQPWWTDVARVTLEHFPTREAAAAAERQAIASENPEHNIVRPGPVDLDAKRARAARRLAQQDAAAAFREAHWRPGRSVSCTNCGRCPDVLPRCQLISDIPCPTCGCDALSRASAATAA